MVVEKVNNFKAGQMPGGRRRAAFYVSASKRNYCIDKCQNIDPAK